MPSAPPVASMWPSGEKQTASSEAMRTERADCARSRDFVDQGGSILPRHGQEPPVAAECQRVDRAVATGDGASGESARAVPQRASRSTYPAVARSMPSGERAMERTGSPVLPAAQLASSRPLDICQSLTTPCESPEARIAPSAETDRVLTPPG